MKYYLLPLGCQMNPIALTKHNPQAYVIGMDISEKMIDIGKAKVEKEGLANQIELRYGDAAALPFEDNAFDAVTVAFGVRNFEVQSEARTSIPLNRAA